MLVGDSVYNNDFDVNCNYSIYDCTNGSCWHEAKVIHTTETSWSKPLDEILDMKIKYITTNDNAIIIEASR